MIFIRRMEIFLVLGVIVDNKLSHSCANIVEVVGCSVMKVFLIAFSSNIAEKFRIIYQSLVS